MTGHRIASGDDFQPAGLERLLARSDAAILSSPCQYEMRRGRLFVSVRLAEIALHANDFTRLSDQLRRARDEARAMLRCSPYDTFGWFSLYWATGNLEGFDERVFAMLAMSYRTGPFEGWISYHRNPQAISAFEVLPESLRARVVKEWRDLVEVWLFVPAASALSRMADAHRKRLLDQGVGIKPEAWSGFARYLEKQGSHFILPGAKYRDGPWL